MIIMFTATVW